MRDSFPFHQAIYRNNTRLHPLQAWSEDALDLDEWQDHYKVQHPARCLIEVLNFITGDYLPPGGKGAIYSTATDCVVPRTAPKSSSDGQTGGQTEKDQQSRTQIDLSSEIGSTRKEIDYHFD